MDGKDEAITISGLHKTFGAGETALEVIKNLDLQVPAGSFAAIMGPSGSGKSTLLHIIAGLLAPGSGSVKIGGREITGMNDREMTVFRRRHIGLIFQDYNLVPTLTAEENIALPLLLDRAPNDEGRIERLMETLGLTARKNHLPSKLSGGERQRVAIARALAGKPTVVLADEPTGNLDSPAAQEFYKLIKKLNRETGCAILMVTHDPVIASHACEVHILHDGEFKDAFATQGDPAVVSSHYLAAMHSGISNENGAKS